MLRCAFACAVCRLVLLGVSNSCAAEWWFTMSRKATHDGLSRSRLSLPALLLSAAVCGVALAGPDFGEGPDAGGLPPTGKTVSSSSSRPVGRVSGTTSTAALTGDGDRVDMFLVRTGSNLTQFKWIGPSWGARLTLFKKESGTCPQSGVTQVLGRPICTVVKAAQGQEFPILNGAAPVIGATGTLASYLFPNSDYFVAVSGATNRPLCDREPCSSSTTDDIDVFSQASGYGQYLANEADRLYGRVARWIDPEGEATGAYAMDVSGTFTLPASTCATATEVRVSGNTAEEPFDFLFAPAVPTGTANVSCAPGYTVSRQFFFTWAPQCDGLAEVTTCGLTGADSAIEVFEVDACTGDACAAAASTAIACNDQCGTGNSSRVTFQAVSGKTYLVRLTRLISSGTQTGTIRFSCTATPPSADLNGDGIVDGADLAVFLARWGTAGN
jgi:hypothetical protein